jgi:cytochrome c553
MAREHGVAPPHTAAILEELRQRKHAGLRHLRGDHVETIASAPERSLDAGNVATLCNACHAEKHRGTHPGRMAININETLP